MNPSSFKTFPWDSVKQKTESEVVALNIMTILARNGDKFRLLEWGEYEAERQKDGNYSWQERGFFDDVVMYTESEKTARLFSKTWNDVKQD